ncbi:protein TIC 22-like, chloroplastic [Coffea arabica]|nr:protein TIC 22-like, chloroplastic [Coffea arabica]
MNFFKTKAPPPAPPPAPPLPPSPSPPSLHLLNQAFTSLQTHVSNFVHHSPLPFPLPTVTNSPAPPAPLHHLNQVFNSFQSHFSNFLHHSPFPFPLPTTAGSSPKNPSWARVSDSTTPSPSPPPSSSDTGITNSDAKSGNLAMTTEVIEERLTGVPVYALSNSSEEFVLVSGENTGRNLGLFCLNEADAKALLHQMQSMDPSMRDGSKVVAVALNKVFQLKVDGVAFRLIPEASQVQNAIKERKKSGAYDESFFGVPVFQSKSLILRTQDKRYRPVFFRKEDLIKSLNRATRYERLNPAFREGEIQVAVFEDIIRGMKDDSSSKWDDVVFIPPGFDVATGQSRR